MQSKNENSDLEERARWLQGTGIKCFLINYKSKFVLPFESKAPWTLHMVTSTFSLIFSLCLCYDYKEILLLMNLVINALSFGSTVAVPTYRHRYGVTNFLVFIIKLITIVISLIIEANSVRAVVISYYVSAVMCEVISGGIFNIHIYRQPITGHVQAEEVEVEVEL